MKLTDLTDLELVTDFKDLVIEEQEALVLQLEFLIEFERRKLSYEHPSLWAFLVRECGMEESAALRKIRAAKLLKSYPALKAPLESGRLNLTLLGLAYACARREQLSDWEFLELTQAISGLSKRGAMREIATRYPQYFEMPPDEIKPLTADLSQVRFVARNELLDTLDEIRGLIAHSHPGASLAELIEVLATEFRQKHHPLEKAKRAELRKQKEEKSEIDIEESPSPAQVHSAPSRSPTQSMIHALVLRDGYRCSYVDPLSGKSCDSTHGLQVDHVRSWASGGATELENLRFLCANHHRRVSFLEFGESGRFQKLPP